MESIIDQARKIAQSANDATRKALIDTLRNLATSFEEPGDTIQRIAYLPIQLSMAQVATDLNLWTILSDSEQGFHVRILAETVGADHVLLNRILRYLSSFNMINELKEDTFGPNNVTRALAMPGLQAGIYHHFDMNPVLQELPKFLADREYKNPANPKDTPFQRAFKTDQVPFQWVQDHPREMKHFGQWMATQRQGMPDWLDVYPIEAECKGSSADILFVDVGGGIGHQCARLRTKRPQLQGRVILQDLPQILHHAASAEGVEHVAQDIFEPQGVKGAKFYYLRNVLHNYPDEECRIILGHLIKAMDHTSSVILIDEMMIPDAGAPWQATQLDITMMSALAGMERTRREWYTLLSSVGLRVVDVYTYTSSLHDSIIAVIPESSKRTATAQHE